MPESGQEPSPDYEAPPEYLPDGEVAKALKRLWARVHAAPPRLKVGIANVVFGVLGVLGGLVAIVALARPPKHLEEFSAMFDVAHESVTAFRVRALEVQLAGTEDEAKKAALRAELDLVRREADAIKAADERDRRARMLHLAVPTCLRLANAAFLALTGVLLLRQARRAKKLARIALWLIPVEFALTSVLCGGPTFPDWGAVLARLLDALRVRVYPLHPTRVVVAVVAFAWVIVYPWLGLRSLARAGAGEGCAATSAGATDARG